MLGADRERANGARAKSDRALATALVQCVGRYAVHLGRFHKFIVMFQPQSRHIRTLEYRGGETIMPHVEFVTLSGFRVREQELLELGMTLPGFAARGAAIAALPALGPLTLAGMLPDDWSCGYRAPTAVDEGLVDELADARPTLVAISSLTASALKAYTLGQSLKRRGIATVYGGLHATAVPDESLRHFDAVCVGDGEANWPAVLDDARQARLGGIYRADQSSPVTSSDQWVMPRFDLLGEQAPRYTVQTQRGCPWACDFCGASRLLGGFREKPSEIVAEELAAIRSLAKRPRVELADDNTFARRHDADHLLDVMEASGVKWFTESDWRLGERPEVLERLAAAGCVQVLVGLESLVFQYPGFGKKRADFERMVDACLAIQEAGVAVNACFIMGADGETPASIDRLISYLCDAPFAEVQLTVQTPFPGTGLYKRLKRDGRLLRDRDWSHYTLFDVVYRPDQMSVTELESRYRDALAAVFGETATRRRTSIRRDIIRRSQLIRPQELAS